jgi:hypothetical protein
VNKSRLRLSLETGFGVVNRCDGSKKVWSYELQSPIDLIYIGHLLRASAHAPATVTH